jgi:hypothetical protein
MSNVATSDGVSADVLYVYMCIYVCAYIHTLRYIRVHCYGSAIATLFSWNVLCVCMYACMYVCLICVYVYEERVWCVCLYLCVCLYMQS